MLTIVGVLNFPYNCKTIDFNDFTFLMKIKTLPQPNLARIYFLNSDLVRECETIPEGITCDNITNNIPNQSIPSNQPEYYIVTLPNKYEICYKERKICTLVPE